MFQCWLVAYVQDCNDHEVHLMVEWIFFRLGPFKVQVLSHAPFSAIFHDFMYDNEMDAYITSAKDKLERSQHQGRHGESESSVLRTSKQVR